MILSEFVCFACEKVFARNTSKHPNRIPKFCSRSCSNSIPHASKGPRGGDEVTYSAFHYRVIAARGKPSTCEKCGLNDLNRKYEWANIEGRYEDVNDYIRLCISCHRKFDRSRGGTRWQLVDGVPLTVTRPRSPSARTNNDPSG